MRVTDLREDVYQMIAAQLDDDGYMDASRIVCRSTMCTASPMQNNPQRLLELVRLGLHAEALGLNHTLERMENSTKQAEGTETGDKILFVPSLEEYSVEKFASKIPKYIPDERQTRFTEKYSMGHQSEVTALAYSPDGAYLVSGDVLGTVHLHDVALIHQRYLFPVLRGYDVRSLCRVYNDHTQPVYTLQFHPFEPFLFSGARDGTIFFHHYVKPDTLKLKRSVKDTFPIRALAIHPDGQGKRTRVNQHCLNPKKSFWMSWTLNEKVYGLFFYASLRLFSEKRRCCYIQISYGLYSER